MSKNLIFSIVGLGLGFFVGFLLANNISGDRRATPPTAAVANATAKTANAPAPPLDPTATNGELPPGHPEINGGGGGTTSAANNSPAASSAQAQSAMEAADRAPTDFKQQMNAAAIFYQAGDFNKASLYLQRALEINPKSVDALTALGNTRYDTNDFIGAATYYERALALEPRDADVQTDLGNTYFRRTPPDFKRAIAEYRKTLAFDPKYEKALQNMGAAAIQLRDKKTASEAVEKLVAVNPQNPVLESLRSSIETLP